MDVDRPLKSAQIGMACPDIFSLQKHKNTFNMGQQSSWFPSIRSPQQKKKALPRKALCLPEGKVLDTVEWQSLVTLCEANI